MSVTTAESTTSTAPRLPLLAAICVAPRRTMRWILERPRRRWEMLSVVLAAVLSYSLRDLDIRGLSKAAEPFGLAATSLFVICIVIAMMLASLAFFYAFALAATWTGRTWLGGYGSFRDVSAALAWGLAPQVWALFYRLPALVFWPEAMSRLYGSNPGLEVGGRTITFSPLFSSDVPVYQILVIAFLDLAFMGWYFVVGSATLAEAHGFSSIRGFANLMLAVVVPFVVMLVLAAAAVLTYGTK